MIMLDDETIERSLPSRFSMISSLISFVHPQTMRSRMQIGHSFFS